VTTSRGWPAPAKLNLFLHVVGRRADGYHLLQTLFQFLDHGDTLDFTVTAEPELTLTPELPGVPAESNLILRAARLLQAETNCRLGARIHLHKRLPMGGGLGGGSSGVRVSCGPGVTVKSRVSPWSRNWNRVWSRW